MLQVSQKQMALGQQANLSRLWQEVADQAGLRQSEAARLERPAIEWVQQRNVQDPRDTQFDYHAIAGSRGGNPSPNSMQYQETMPKFADTEDAILALDLRIDPVLATQLRAPAAQWSFWPEAPFGSSADASVWPSLFSKTPETDRIFLEPGEAAYWQAMGVWDDLQDIAQHTLPVAIASELIAIGLCVSDVGKVPPDTLVGQLIEIGIHPDSQQTEATLLGYDIVDVFLSSALFDAAAPADVDRTTVPRSAAGLIETKDAARALLPVLEAADPAHAPLLIVSVFSLGHRPATVMPKAAEV